MHSLLWVSEPARVDNTARMGLTYSIPGTRPVCLFTLAWCKQLWSEEEAWQGPISGWAHCFGLVEHKQEQTPCVVSPVLMWAVGGAEPRLLPPEHLPSPFWAAAIRPLSRDVYGTHSSLAPLHPGSLVSETLLSQRSHVSEQVTWGPHWRTKCNKINIFFLPKGSSQVNGWVNKHQSDFP